MEENSGQPLADRLSKIREAALRRKEGFAPRRELWDEEEEEVLEAAPARPAPRALNHFEEDFGPERRPRQWEE